jgi:hypothetical protein
MLKARLAIATLGLAMTLSNSVALLAQTADVPAAPLPSQITAAKKVFISNAGVGIGNTYNEFYAAIKSWGRYELVAAPVDADLALEISLFSGSDASLPHLKLVLLDTKTRIALWAFSEPMQPYARQKTGEKNKQDAMNKLVDDLKSLTTQPTTAAK